MIIKLLYLFKQFNNSNQISQNMASIKKNWIEKLESLPVAPSFSVSDEDKASVSTTMSRLHLKGNKEFAIKKSRITNENIIVRIV